MVGTPLRELDLPDGIRIGAIYRDKETIVPNGDTVVKSKDRIVIFATAERVSQVEQMFRVSLEFF
jgi:trk system potassium uptake protein TrkA